MAELIARELNEAVEDSSGNAGASFAAYAARGNIAAKIFVPESTSAPKQAQIEAFGAELVLVPGPRSESAQAVRDAADKGAIYASHAYLPFGLPGLATIAYELLDQLGEVPGTIIAPAGHGSLLLGISQGFDALKRAGEITTKPRLIAVQARACAPLWAVVNMGASGLAWVTEGETLAQGVQVTKPTRGDELVKAIEASGGTVLAVEEEEIVEGRNALAKLGFYVEPTSAIVWSALQQVLPEIPEPIVTILTSSGLKSS
jgi:threonine synthase